MIPLPDDLPELSEAVSNQLEDIISGLLINGIAPDRITYGLAYDLTDVSVYLDDRLLYSIIPQVHEP